MLFIEIVLSMHVLLFLSAWVVSKKWLLHAPSLKLQFARILLVSCVLSPVVVQCMQKTEKPQLLKFESLDTIQEFVSKPILKTPKIDSTGNTAFLSKMNTMHYGQFFVFLFCLLVVYRSYGLFLDLRKLKNILDSAIDYRTSRSLVIKVSHDCHIPFSVRVLHKAYIILPMSLLASHEHVKMAIAHEGQHHRNGDCVWAYFLEGIRIVFFGNPGVTRWLKLFTELQEFSCDEVLVKHHKISAHDYGHCLFKVVKTVSHYSESPKEGLACTVGMDSGSNNQESAFIIRRISMLSRYPLNTSTRPMLGIGLAVVLPICSAYAVQGSLSESYSKALDISDLNPVIQKIAVQEIAAAIKQYHAKSGVIVVAQPNTGKIVAFAEKMDGQKSWKSRVFSPGSTIKPFVAAAAIDAGKIEASKMVDCSSPYVVDGQQFMNSDPDVKSLSFIDAMAKSENTCIIKVAEEMGPDTFRKKLSEFGFDMKSAWQSNDSQALQLANAAIGVSIPVTLESLTKAYAILANKGHSNTHPVISESSAHSITKILEHVIQEGTGKKAAVPGIAVAGKTGTLVEENKGTRLALFGGYLPADAPRFVVLVVLEDGYQKVNGKRLTQGGEIAAPVFHNVGVQLNASSISQ